MDGSSYKMSLNWGEISKGSYQLNKKVGVWEKLTNNGYCMIQDKNETKVTFPYINDDYYEGKISYKWEDYQLIFLKGTYVSMKKERQMDHKKLVNVINFPL